VKRTVEAECHNTRCSQHSWNWAETVAVPLQNSCVSFPAKLRLQNRAKLQRSGCRRRCSDAKKSSVLTTITRSPSRYARLKVSPHFLV